MLAVMESFRGGCCGEGNNLPNKIVSLLISPVLLLQAVITKRRALKLPEPPGLRKGVAGTGTKLRLLIIGDSAAAGVGAEHQDEALSGQLVGQLAEKFCVDWRLDAVSGATTDSTLASLAQLVDRKYDVVVTSLGVNDVTSRIGCGEWLSLQRKLRNVLSAKFGVSLIVVSGMPPMHEFPGLPQPLRRYLGARATQFDHALESEIGNDKSSVFLSLRFPGKAGDMARDGFHPGPAVFKEWAKRVAEVILDRYL
jgi:lysophospholipase L1-like esterase